MDNKSGVLNEIGLTNGESKIYLCLLELGTLTASQVSKETKLNRSNLYRMLERLIEKKLIFTSIIEKTKYFSITRPERILELYQEKVSYFKKEEENIKRFIKGAERLNNIKIPESEFAVEVHEGIEEIKRVMQDVLNIKKNNIVYAIGKEGLLANYPGIKYWFDGLIKQRVSKMIFFRAVYNFHENAGKVKSKNTNVKYANLAGMGDIEISFYRDNLLIYVITKEKPRVILIRSKEIVNTMIIYFNFLWEKAKQM